MTIAPSPPRPVGDDAAQALFEEARRRRLRRRRWWSAVVVVVAVLVLVLVQVLVGGPTRVTSTHVGGAPAGPVMSPGRTKGTAQSYPASGWSTPGLLSGVSCAGSTCVAVGYSGAGAADGAHESGAGARAHVLVSNDGGVTWTAGSLPAGVTDMAAVTCVTDTACLSVGRGARGGSHGAVALVSANAGASWVRATVPASTLPLDAVACASVSVCTSVAQWPPNEAPGPPGTVALHTTDGGRTWVPSVVPSAVAGLSTVSCTPGGFCLAAGEGPASARTTGKAPQLILASTDGGTRWATVSVPTGFFSFGQVPTTLAVDTVKCTTGEHCILTGLLDGTKSGDAFVTDDGGVTWTPSTGWQAADGGGPGVPSAVACPGPTTCVAVAMYYSFEAASVLVSDDGGRSWRDVPAEYSLPGLEAAGGGFSTLAAISCTTSSSCVVVGQGQRGWLFAATTTDGAATWSPSRLPVPLGALQGVSCWNATSCLAVGTSATDQGVALATSDGAARWSDVPLPPGTPPLDAVSCPARRQCVAVGDDADGATPSHAVALSTDDGGASWTTTTIAPGTALSSLACPSPMQCWVTGESGGIFGSAFVSVSRDGGRTWQPSTLPAGLPAVAGLSCTGPGDCVAVTVDADLASDPGAGSVVLRLVGAAGGGRWERVGTIPARWAPTGVGDSAAGTPDLLRCLRSGPCLLATAVHAGGAPAWRGRVLSSVDGGRTWKVAERSPDDFQALAGIACPRLDECIGVGSGPPNHGAGIVATRGDGTAPSIDAIPAGVGSLDGITCPSAVRCIAVGTAVGAAAVLTTGDAGRAWEPASLPAWLEGTSVSSG